MTNDDTFLDEAASIGDHLVANAVWHRGRCNWLRRTSEHTDGSRAMHPTLQALDASVYAGTAGIALFLARLHSHTRSPSHRDAARGAAMHAVLHAQALARPRHLHAGRPYRYGYYAGPLGVVWTAHECARLLDEPALARDARRILGEVAAERVGRHELDLIGGSAGAIVTLLRLRQEGYVEADSLVQRLGRHLLRVADVNERGTWSWRTLASATETFERNLAGFSHGTSGIGWALAELYAADGNDEYRQGALGAFAYEREAFDSSAGNWPDLRGSGSGPLVFQNRWCHGAPGIGLARVLAYPLLKDERLLDEARVAVRATRAALQGLIAEPGEDFTFCCGMGGVVESLWVTEDRLGDSEGLLIARDVARCQIERYGAAARREWAGAIEWPTGTVAGASPNLQQGIAGIGHFFLRLHDPRAPSIVMPPAPGA